MTTENRSKEELLSEVGALEERLRQLRLGQKWQTDIMSVVADWVWEVDVGGLFTYSSQKSTDILGYSREEIIGKTPFDFMPPEEAKKVAEVFSKIVAERVPIKDLENWNIRKDGKRICLLTNGVAIWDEAGNFKGYRGVDKDITERKETLEKLSSYETRLSYLTKYANDFIILLDKDFRFLETNLRVSDFYGYTQEELIGMQAADIRAPEVRAAFQQQVKPAQLTGQAIYETIHQRKDGTKFPVEISLRTIDAEGKRLYLAVIRDITERKNAEAALQTTENQMKLLVENIKVGITYMDKDYKIIFTNKAQGELFKRPPEEFVGKFCFAEFEKRDAICPHCPGKKAMVSGCHESSEATGVRNSGEKFQVRINAFPYFQVDGKIAGFIETVEDITERKKLEEATKKHVQELEVFYKAAMGREERILDLKKEIDSLKKELKK